MKRLFAAFAVMAGALALLAGPASAQDAEITVEPSSVAAPGTYDIVVTGANWTGSPIYVIPCIFADDAASLDAQGGDCNLGGMQTPAPADGAFEVTLSVEVAEDGASIIASDNPPTQSGFAQITVDASLAQTGSETGMILIIAGALVGAGALFLMTTRRRALI